MLQDTRWSIRRDLILSGDSPLTPAETKAVLSWPWRPFAALSEAKVDEIQKLKALGEIPDQELFRWRKECPDASKILDYAAERIWARAHQPTLEQFGGIANLVIPLLTLFQQCNLDNPDWNLVRLLLLEKGIVGPDKLKELTLPEIRDCLHMVCKGVIPGGEKSKAHGLYRFIRNGPMWDLHFGDEGIPMPHSKALGYLHTLVTDPRSRHLGLSVVEIQHAKPEEVPDTGIFRDATADEDAIKDYQRRLRQISVEKEGARNAGNQQTLDGLIKEERELRRFMQLANIDENRDAEDQWGVRNLGPLPGHQKIADAIRKSLSRIYVKIREGGLPNMAKHFEIAVIPEKCRFYYKPSPAINWKTKKDT